MELVLPHQTNHPLTVAALLIGFFPAGIVLFLSGPG